MLLLLLLLLFVQAEPFLKPVNLQQNPGYEEFVFNPMDLSTLEKVGLIISMWLILLWTCHKA